MQVLCGLQGIFLLFNCQTPETGEGIEKKVDDFAAEVAAQAGM